MPETADNNLLGTIDALLQKSESLSDPSAKKLLEETIRALMDLHGAALSRIMERISESDQGQTLIDSLAEDSVINSLLLVYSLHPQSLEERVGSALDSVRPYLASHGGSVELLGISDEGAVHLRMQGSCHGCPSSEVTLKTSIEKAVFEKAPDVVAIHVEGEDPMPSVPHVHHSKINSDGFVPIEHLTAGRMRLPLQPAVSLSGADL
jgi:Fe-S cluster biogenesis protein NfuA